MTGAELRGEEARGEVGIEERVVVAFSTCSCR